MNSTYYGRMSITSYRQNDIDFDKYKKNIEAEIPKSWLGFKYLTQLEQRKEQVISKIEKYISKLKSANGDLILQCEFTFNQNLDLLIKSSDIRRDFIDQLPPNVNPGVKINQPDLLTALTQIKTFLYKECAACKDELYKNQKCNGDIWNQAGWILQNNNEKEGENYQKLVEKYRKSMVNALTNPKVDQEQYIEFQSYLIHYYQYFDQYNVNQRSQICEQFLQYLNLLENKEELSQKYNTNFKNNSLMIQPNKTFVVNLPAPPQFQISIPKFLWGEIQKYGLQGYIIYRMIENQELNLNYQVIDKIFLSKVREQQQRYPGNVGRKK
ncbi:unnamed protein product (macronuclear) [Paramecium tetraurelia]|uniref:Uncharacterized protein n=1 Tax=Paramecium tetraurelia TaxID=5888 RepID=A0C0M6_PARTE|nr:uncharacterized protein GSPATT00006196001 [Paramecium tetraurelia]CAK64343.1 unnamed protein product [Paramecium tetraurelia]|eukprot:XP_001431741.1 hypothetical protein (macronuclear) [Paramecium tetraurelia strain d4-2]